MLGQINSYVVSQKSKHVIHYLNFHPYLPGHLKIKKKCCGFSSKVFTQKIFKRINVCKDPSDHASTKE